MPRWSSLESALLACCSLSHADNICCNSSIRLSVLCTSMAKGKAWEQCTVLRFSSSAGASSEKVVSRLVSSLQKYPNCLLNLREFHLSGPRQYDPLFPLLLPVQQQIVAFTLPFEPFFRVKEPMLNLVCSQLERISIGVSAFETAALLRDAVLPRLESLSVTLHMPSAIGVLRALGEIEMPSLRYFTVQGTDLHQSETPEIFQLIFAKSRDAKKRGHALLRLTLIFSSYGRELDAVLGILKGDGSEQAADLVSLGGISEIAGVTLRQLRFGKENSRLWSRLIVDPKKDLSSGFTREFLERAYTEIFDDADLTETHFDALSSILRVTRFEDVGKWALDHIEKRVLSCPGFMALPSSRVDVTFWFIQFLEKTLKLQLDWAIVASARCMGHIRDLLSLDPRVLERVVIQQCEYVVTTPTAIAHLLGDAEVLKLGQIDFSAIIPFPSQKVRGWFETFRQEPAVLAALAQNPSIDLAKADPLSSVCIFILDQREERFAAARALVARYLVEPNGKALFIKSIGQFDEYSLRGMFSDKSIVRDLSGFWSSVDELLASKFAENVISLNGSWIPILEATAHAIFLRTHSDAGSWKHEIQVKIWICGLKSPHARYSNICSNLREFSSYPSEVVALMQGKGTTLHGLHRHDIIRNIIKARGSSTFSSRSGAMGALNDMRPKDDPTPSMNW